MARMKIVRGVRHPLYVLRNKDLSYGARTFFTIWSLDGYYRPENQKIQSLIDYFKQFTNDSYEQIENYILELSEYDLIDIE